MTRLPIRLFTNLAFVMPGMGLLIGLLFPFLATVLGFTAEGSLTPGFWAATGAAGLLIGTANLAVAGMVARPRLRRLSDRMSEVERAVRDATYSGDWSGDGIGQFHAPVDGDDDIGRSARAFNDLVDALFRSHRTTSAAAAFAMALSSELELHSLAIKALSLFLKHTGAAAGAVLAAPGGEPALLAHHGLTDPGLLLQSDRVRSILRGGACEKLASHERDSLESLAAAFHPHEVMLVPAVFNGAPVGLVVLATADRFDPDTEWLLHMFRRHLGLALNNAFIHDQLQRTAAVDPLTGLYNRRFGLTRLNEEFKRAVRFRLELGVMMLDIDHFKRINDTHGHLTGDRILARVAGILSASFREEDVLIRYGGEEFLAVLPGASPENCLALAERVRRRVADLATDADGIRATISIGVANYPEHPVESARELVALADRALYDAKHGGRNRVARAS